MNAGWPPWKLPKCWLNFRRLASIPSSWMASFESFSAGIL